MKKLFNKEQEEFIVSNYLTMKYSDIAKSLGDYTSTQITGWLNNNGYKKGHNSIFSREDIDYIRENYLEMTYGEIAKELGFTEKQVKGWINHNCDKKVRTFNDRYFDKIKTPNQAYWLGFIYADGYVIKRTSVRNYELGIQIQSCDIKLLEDFNNELGGVHSITYSHDEKYICGNPKISITDSVTLRIYSKNIVDDLIKNNVIQNKTQSPIFPIVKDDLFFDFLRGYIDGDGCIYINQDKVTASQIHITSAHDEILNYIKDKLSLYGINSYVYKEKERKHRIYVNHKDAIKLLDLIYYDKNVQKLNRKYEKYLLLKRLS
jgi:hypothetical protein